MSGIRILSGRRHTGAGAPAVWTDCMKIAVPKEIMANERRVALIPDAAGRLVKAGHEVLIETGAGVGADFLDDAYRAAGATIVPDPVTLYGAGEIVLKVQKPQVNPALGKHEVDLMKPG